MKFIIEHLDGKVWKWSLLEYTHISSIVGKKNLIFTNINYEKDREKLKKIGTVHKETLQNIKLKNVCVLDPQAKQTLTKKDSKFDYIVLGGILGDFPPRKRTKIELTDVLGYPARNLGKLQMSTNTAAIVAWKILHGTSLKKMEFKRGITVKINKYLEMKLPYQFLLEKNELVLPKGYIEMAKKRF